MSDDLCVQFEKASIRGKRLTEIHQWIEEGYDPKLCKALSDDGLMSKFMATEAAKRDRRVVMELLAKFNDHEECASRITEYFMRAGIKGVVRGAEFNKYIAKVLQNIVDELPGLELKVEADTEGLAERPDWVIQSFDGHRVLAGYNQIDLWSGGEQINRGDKYVTSGLSNLPPGLKVISVVCDFCKITKETNKKFKLFDAGIKNKTIVYPRHLNPYIHEYFSE